MWDKLNRLTLPDLRLGFPIIFSYRRLSVATLLLQVYFFYKWFYYDENWKNSTEICLIGWHAIWTGFPPPYLCTRRRLVKWATLPVVNLVYDVLMLFRRDGNNCATHMRRWRKRPQTKRLIIFYCFIHSNIKHTHTHCNLWAQGKKTR